MKIEVNNQGYYVSFPELTHTLDNKESNARTILCSIKKIREDGSLKAVSTTGATCLNKQYVRTVSERTALLQAMKRLGWDKATRTLVWDQYFLSSRRRRKLVGLEMLNLDKLQTA